MPRTEVYQLRLTKSEKDELAEKARSEGISIAKLIRWRVGLDTKDEPGVVLHAEDLEAHREEPAVAARLKRVNELARTMPRANAERLARKELQ